MLTQRLWQHATRGVPGVTHHHEAMVAFCARHWLDMLGPANNPLTNPMVPERTLAEGGANLLRGRHHALDDLRRDVLDLPPAGAEDLRLSKQFAVTAGHVVLRTPLAELFCHTKAIWLV